MNKLFKTYQFIIIVLCCLSLAVLIFTAQSPPPDSTYKVTDDLILIEPLPKNLKIDTSSIPLYESLYTGRELSLDIILPALDLIIQDAYIRSQDRTSELNRLPYNAPGKEILLTWEAQLQAQYLIYLKQRKLYK